KSAPGVAARAARRLRATARAGSKIGSGGIPDMARCRLLAYPAGEDGEKVAPVVDDRAARIKGKGWAGWMAGLPGRLLFPPVCPACRRLVAQPFTLCGACWPKLRFI